MLDEIRYNRLKLFDHSQSLSAPPGEPVPLWNIQRMEKRNCIFCGSSNYSIVCYRPDGLEVGQCNECGGMYCPVIPDEDQLRDYYNLYSKTKPYMQGPSYPLMESKFYRFKKIVFKILNSNKLTRIALNIKKSIRPIIISETCEILIRTGGLRNKNILEVGPGKGAGILPEVRLLGGNCIAIEIDETASRYINEMGFIVYSDISEVKQAVDVIYLGMVLEHIKDPKNFLKSLRSIHNKGGRILVIVPNAGQALELGNNWVGFRVDLEHINYFDQYSINRILNYAGYQIECVWINSQPILPGYTLFTNQIQRKQYLKKTYKKRLNLNHDTLFRTGQFALTILARYY